MGALLGLVITQISVAAGGRWVNAIYGPGGSIALGWFWVPDTQKCPETADEAKLSDAELKEWEECRELVRDWKKYTFNLPDNYYSSVRHAVPRTIQQTSATTASSFSLTSSTPDLPFLGNPLAVIGAVPNSTDLNSITAQYDVFLRRQADCSLAEDLVLLDSSQTTPSGSLITSLPSAQDYFHKLAGLTTTADTFAQGCTVPTLGQPSTDNILLLGTTASGAVISATVGNNGVNVSVTDTTANTFTTTQSIAAATLGGFTAADVNGDGFADLVITFVTDPATNQPSTGIYLGNGDGTFRAGVFYDVAGDVSVDDVNGDGKPDIVVCGATTRGVTTLIGAGNGTFTAGAASATGISACTQGGGQVITADFNNDGKKDLLRVKVQH